MREFLLLLWLLPVFLGSPLRVSGQDVYPHNAVSCERCHNTPSEFGGSAMTVIRIGISRDGAFTPTAEGGIRHRYGESQQNTGSGLRCNITRDFNSSNVICQSVSVNINASSIVAVSSMLRQAVA